MKIVDSNGNCVDRCYSTCNNCTVQGDENNHMCTECKEGKYGIEQCQNNCSENCLYNTCDIDTGYCPCKPGYFGRQCDKVCEGCLDTCDVDTGECTNHDCKKGFFNAKYCNNICNEGCQCDMFTGDCFFCENNKKCF